MKKRLILLILLTLPSIAFAQENKLTLTGYLKDLWFYFHPETQIPATNKRNLYSNNIHNRLIFRWYLTDRLTFGTELRNRLLCGTMVRELPLYKSAVDYDPGYADMAVVPGSGDSWFLHSMVDRLWVEYTRERWQVTLGRQRINWGMNLVWNPNDLFNTFSVFDFDYEERPGCDAVRIKYFTGATSFAELAFKAGHTSDENCFAGLYRFTLRNYDIQVLAGCTPVDFIVGTGWSGDIIGGAFRGEVSWFIPEDRGQNRGTIVASVSGDYTFHNNIYFQGGFLFNSRGTTGKSTGISLFDLNLSVKEMSLSKYSLLLQASYPFTPLFSATITSIVNAGDGSFYLGPQATYSLSNNLELMVTGQLFLGHDQTEYGETGKAAFFRLKYAF
jgi:hypothetical protein